MTETSTPRVIDLDAAREARAAAQGEAPQLRWKGDTYQLPPELPVRFLEAIAVDDFEPAFTALFEGEGFDVGGFLDTASFEDLRELADGIARVYGLEGGLGNLPSSTASSSTTSKR